MLELDQIRIDGGTQSRVELSQETVAEYAQAFQAGAQFPAVVVFFDGASYWLADGFHRYFGARDAGESAIAVQIINGTQRDAVLYSLKANATHGLKRTNADKRKAVETLLKDSEWATWSDRKIAEICGVHHDLAGKVRNELSGGNRQISEQRTVERNGKTYEQNTANIGKKKPAESNSIPLAPVHQAAEPAPKSDSLDTPEDDGPSAEEIAAHAAAEAADREMVAKLLDSNEPLAALVAENKQLKAEIAQLKMARDSYMNRCNEAIALVKSRDRKIAKLEKLVGTPA